MRILLSIPVTVLMLLCAGVHSARSDTPTLSSLMGSKRVLVIGEAYGRPESALFVSEAVSEYISGGGCLKVGLEISSDQQDTLDSAMRGDVPVSDIRINDIIDSPSYRRMLTVFSSGIKAGGCLSVAAIDAPASVPVSRDGWMEKQVLAMTGETPVVLLVGNARAVKETGVTDTGQMLAERLTEQSVSVVSAVQYWGPGQCEDRESEYITASDDRSGTFIKEIASQSSGGDVTVDASLAADGVLVWKCRGTDISAAVNVEDSASGTTVTEDVSETEEETIEVVRDDKTLKKIRWGIKNNYPVIGMTEGEVIQAMREEPASIERSGNAEKWKFECGDEDGFTYTCFVLEVKDGIVVKFK